KQIDAGRDLRLENVRDYAVVYLDGNEAGVVSRVEHASLDSRPEVTLPADGHGTLEVLVDTFGHINFGPRLGDHKGLIGPVTLDGKPLHDVQAWPLALDDEAWLRGLRPLATAPSRGGVFFRANLHVEAPGDVYIDVSGWSKGYLWVNGRLLGRYWHVGPQRRLFCPGPWLRAGDNELLMLDLHRFSPAVVTAAEDLDGLRPAPIASRAGSYRAREGLGPIASRAGSYRGAGNGWEPTLLAMAGRDMAHREETAE
ncbi:MAG: hypothetical protein ABWZ85_08510, partial [Luteibacter sp.]